MEKYLKSFIINLGLLFSGAITIFSGMYVQVNFHMGNHGLIPVDAQLSGVYALWTDIHKISIIMLVISLVFHVYLHWKWYKNIFGKRLAGRQRQVLILSLLFVIVSLTGLIPWSVHLLNGDEMLRKSVIEIHDKLAIILSIYLILHVIKRANWFFTTFRRVINAHSN